MYRLKLQQPDEIGAILANSVEEEKKGQSPRTNGTSSASIITDEAKASGKKKAKKGG